MMRREYVKPRIRVVELLEQHHLSAGSEDKRGYAIDNEEADDDKIIDVTKQTDYFSLDLD